MTIPLIILTAYLLICGYLFGITNSISHTHYHWIKAFGSRKAGWAFSVFVTLLVASIVPTWIDRTPDSIQFIPFLSCGGLLFLGVSPNFYVGMERRIHIAGTCICAIMAGVWCALVGMWMSIIFIALISLWAFLFWRNKVLYFVEVSIFYAVIISIYTYDKI